jgi:AcrR family transcriptional regulator
MVDAENSFEILILEKAAVLFKEFGLKKTRVRDITREAGISRPTFYKYFRNKYDVVVTLLELKWIPYFKKGREILLGNDSLQTKLAHLIKDGDELTELLGEKFLFEAWQNDIRLRGFFDKLERKRKTALALFLERAKHGGQIRSDVSQKEFFILLRNLRDLERMFRPSFKLPLRNRKLISYFFYGISGSAPASNADP